MLADSPDETREALDAIEHAGEQALVEMRRLLGMLRRDDGELAADDLLALVQARCELGRQIGCYHMRNSSMNCQCR